jgi:hypothetical protein
MQEDQLPNLIISKGDHSQHVTKVLDIGRQWAPIVPLGELQKLHPILKHKVVWHEPPIQPQLELLPREGFE